MSEGMSSEQIERVFGSLARIEQKIDSNAETLRNHVGDDQRVQKALFERLETLAAGVNRQKGYMTAIGAVSGGVVAALGYLADRLLGHH